MSLSNRIKENLNQASPAVFAGYAILAAFSTYFSMYAFRKPFRLLIMLSMHPLFFLFWEPLNTKRF
jgi:hypothetical protein